MEEKYGARQHQINRAAGTRAPAPPTQRPRHPAPTPPNVKQRRKNYGPPRSSVLAGGRPGVGPAPGPSRRRRRRTGPWLAGRCSEAKERPNGRLVLVRLLDDEGNWEGTMGVTMGDGDQGLAAETGGGRSPRDQSARLAAVGCGRSARLGPPDPVLHSRWLGRGRGVRCRTPLALRSAKFPCGSPPPHRPSRPPQNVRMLSMARRPCFTSRSRMAGLSSLSGSKSRSPARRSDSSILLKVRISTSCEWAEGARGSTRSGRGGEEGGAWRPRGGESNAANRLDARVGSPQQRPVTIVQRAVSGCAPSHGCHPSDLRGGPRPRLLSRLGRHVPKYR